MTLRRSLFLLLTFAILIPTTLFGVWTYKQSYQNELDGVMDRHLLLAKNVRATLAAYNKSVVVTFRMLVRNAYLGNEVVGTSDLLDKVSINHLCIISPQSGRVVAHVDNVDAPCPAMVPEQRLAFFLDTATQDEPKFTSITLGPTNQPTLYLVWLYEDALSVASIDPKQIVDVAKSISFGESGHAAVVDHTGKLLAHPLENWRLEMKDLSKLDLVQAMLQGKTGISTFFSPAMKADMIAGYTSVPGSGWGIMVPQPIAELEQQASSVKALLFDLVTPSLLLAGLISWLLSGFLINPINSVVNAAKKMQSGDLSARVGAPNTLTPIELISLGHSFNAMASGNQQAYDDLATTKLISDRAVSMLGLGVATWDIENGTFLSASNQFSQIWGATSEDLVKREDCLEKRLPLIKNAHQQRYVGYLAARSHQEFSEVEYTIHSKDKPPLHLIESSQKTDDINGHQPTYIITLRDITEIRNTAKQLQQGQKMEAIGNMAGGIAHDLNNVLSIASANLELLKAQSDNLGEDDTTRINAAQLANQRGASLIEKLLKFSRKSEPAADKIDVNQSLASFKDLVKHSIQTGTNINLSFNLSDNSLYSRLSEGEFHDALLNLIFNSRDAIKENGHITISTYLGKDPINNTDKNDTNTHAVVCVSDDGSGISEHHLTRVFEPFYTTKPVGTGSGLGLSMVYGFIKRSGASIQIDSELGVGTKVIMHFPLYS